MRSGNFSQSRVLPTMSVKRNVTVPRGASAMCRLNQLFFLLAASKERKRNKDLSSIEIKQLPQTPHQYAL